MINGAKQTPNPSLGSPTLLPHVVTVALVLLRLLGNSLRDLLVHTRAPGTCGSAARVKWGGTTGSPAPEPEASDAGEGPGRPIPRPAAPERPATVTLLLNSCFLALC